MSWARGPVRIDPLPAYRQLREHLEKIEKALTSVVFGTLLFARSRKRLAGRAHQPNVSPVV